MMRSAAESDTHFPSMASHFAALDYPINRSAPRRSGLGLRSTIRTKLILDLSSSSTLDWAFSYVDICCIFHELKQVEGVSYISFLFFYLLYIIALLWNIIFKDVKI